MLKIVSVAELLKGSSVVGWGACKASCSRLPPSCFPWRYVAEML